MTDTEPQDRDSPTHCSATTGRGTKCQAYARKGQETCIAHSPEGEAVRAKAVLASAKARKRTVDDRKLAKEDAKLSLTEALARDVAVERDAIVAALIARAKDGDMRAQSILWERSEGKVADHLVTTAGDPFTMTEAELAKWIATEDDTVSDSALPDHP